MDLIVANEHELMSLYLTDDLEAALRRAEADVAITVCTLGARGAYVLAAAGGCTRRRRRSRWST